MTVNKIMSEVKELDEKDKIALYYEIEKMFGDSVYRQDSVSIESAFGLWKDRTIDKDTLRKNAWVKN